MRFCRFVLLSKGRTVRRKGSAPALNFIFRERTSKQAEIQSASHRSFPHRDKKKLIYIPKHLQKTSPGVKTRPFPDKLPQNNPGPTMASELKRKRGPAGVQAAPKRAKSVKSPVAAAAKKPLQKLGLDNGAGWDAAFNPSATAKGTELVVATNGAAVNGHSTAAEEEDLADAEEEPLDYEVLEKQEREKNKAMEEYGAPMLPKPMSKTWRLSESIGGRMIDVEPVFSLDEK